jgi:hypothetical protein
VETITFRAYEKINWHLSLLLFTSLGTRERERERER